MAAQRLCRRAAHLVGGGRRGAWLRSASESQYRQTSHPFLVPSGVHAVRPDPDHAGKPLASADGNLHRHAGCSAAVLKSIWRGLKYEGSPETVSSNGKSQARYFSGMNQMSIGSVNPPLDMPPLDRF